MVLLFIADLLKSIWNLLVCFFMGVGAATIFTVFGTLAVMFIGKGVDTLIRRSNKSKDRKQIRQLVYLNCENLVHELTVQSDVFKEIGESIEIDSNDPIPMKSFEIFSHKVIEQVKYDCIYDAFHGEMSTDEKRRTFSLLWRSIATINNTISNRADFSIDFIKESNRLQRELETNLSAIATLVGNIMTSIHGTMVPHEASIFYLGIEDVNKSMQGDANPLTKINEHYIEPLLKLFNTPANYAFHRNGEIPNLLRKASNDFTNLKNYHDISKENAYTLSSSCLNIASNIKEFLNTFRNSIHNRANTTRPNNNRLWNWPIQYYKSLKKSYIEKKGDNKSY